MLMIDEHDARGIVSDELGLDHFEEVCGYHVNENGEFVIEGTIAIDNLSPQARQIAAGLTDDGYVYAVETYTLPMPGTIFDEVHLGSVDFKRDPRLNG